MGAITLDMLVNCLAMCSRGEEGAGMTEEVKKWRGNEDKDKDA